MLTFNKGIILHRRPKCAVSFLYVSQILKHVHLNTDNKTKQELQYTFFTEAISWFSSLLISTGEGVKKK